MFTRSYTYYLLQMKLSCDTLRITPSIPSIRLCETASTETTLQVLQLAVRLYGARGSPCRRAESREQPPSQQRCSPYHLSTLKNDRLVPCLPPHSVLVGGMGGWWSQEIANSPAAIPSGPCSSPAALGVFPCVPPATLSCGALPPRNIIGATLNQRQLRPVSPVRRAGRALAHWHIPRAM